MARKFVLQTSPRPEALGILADLNPEQRAVAAAPGGPMLVIAGAGTGKTRPLTYRLAGLIHHGESPSRHLHEPRRPRDAPPR